MEKGKKNTAAIGKGINKPRKPVVKATPSSDELPATSVEASLEKYQSLFENSLEGIGFSRGNQIIDANRALLTIFGYDNLKEFQAVPLLEAVAPESRELVAQYLSREPSSETPRSHFRFKILRKDGQTRDIEISTARIQIGDEIYAQSTFRDITDQKQAEEALKESEERFRKMTEVTFEGICIHEAGKIVDVNPALLAMFGYDLSEVIGKNVLDFVAPDSREKIIKSIAAGSEKALEANGLRKDGSFFPLEVLGKAMPQPGSKLRVTALHDITERKRMEEGLRKSEEKYRTLVDELNDGFYVSDIQGKLIFVNKGLAHILGFENPDQIIGKRFLEFVSPPDAKKLQQQYREAMATGADSQSFVTEIIRQNGSTAFVEIKPQVVKANDLVVGDRGIVSDITARRQAEEKLRYQAAILSNVSDAVIASDDKFRLNAWNAAAESLYGWKAEEVLGHLGIDVLKTEWLGADPQEMRNSIARSGYYRGEATQAHKDGRRIPVELSSLVLHDVNGNISAYISVNRDITERKRQEQDKFHRLAELETVSRISTALRGARDVDEMLPLLMDETLKIVGTEVGEIWLYDPVSFQLRKAISRGWMVEVKEPALSPGEGIAGHVFKTGQPYTSRELIKDLQVEQTVLPEIPAGWGGICVPIRAEQQSIGVLCIYVQMPRHLEKEDVNLLTTISDIAGNAIRRVRLYEETLHQVKRLAALRSMDSAIGSVLDMNVILDILLGHIITQLGVDAADILLYQPHVQMLEYKAGRGFHSPALQKFSERLGEGHAGRAALEKRIVGETSTNMNPLVPCARVQQIPEEGFVAHYAAPLLIKGQVKGVLETFHRSTFTPDAEWLEFLATLAAQVAIAVDNSQMFENLQNSNYELMMAYDETIEGWSQAMDLRDRETEGHSQRVTEITMHIAEILGSTPEQMIHIRRGALLHDIGKLGVPDEILRKTGPLSEEDWVHMRKHPQAAYDMLSPIKYLHPALDIPYCHHEKWDGSGYPRGLRGEQIPLVARIFSVVDVYDALTSDRPYRKAWSKEKSLAYIQAQAGFYFDPQVVETFLREMEPGKR